MWAFRVQVRNFWAPQICLQSRVSRKDAQRGAGRYRKAASGSALSRKNQEKFLNFACNRQNSRQSRTDSQFCGQWANRYSHRKLLPDNYLRFRLHKTTPDQPPNACERKSSLTYSLARYLRIWDDSCQCSGWSWREKCGWSLARRTLG